MGSMGVGERMGIVRNCPVDVVYAPTFQLFVKPVEQFKNTPVVELVELEKLFAALSKECLEWQKSDGKIWWNSPEEWLRKQLNLPKVKK